MSKQGGLWTPSQPLLQTHVCVPLRSVADEIIRRHTMGPCILDGEMVVWNKKRWEQGPNMPQPTAAHQTALSSPCSGLLWLSPSRQCFEPFGSIKPLVTAIRDKKPAGGKLEVRCPCPRLPPLVAHACRVVQQSWA